MAEDAEQKIRLMDDVLASQVAAGEVVERPASVVKELVENSIDAGARCIRVEISRGGISRLKVADDGSGMSRADAEMCLLRHATSKLLDAAGLFDIRHLGFRGEALPSIASVAHIDITTRRAVDLEGTRITCDGGEMEPPMSAGCAPDTEICVTNLFFKRLKLFLAIAFVVGQFFLFRLHILCRILCGFIVFRLFFHKLNYYLSQRYTIL